MAHRLFASLIFAATISLTPVAIAIPVPLTDNSASPRIPFAGPDPTVDSAPDDQARQGGDSAEAAKALISLSPGELVIPFGTAGGTVSMSDFGAGFGNTLKLGVPIRKWAVFLGVRISYEHTGLVGGCQAGDRDCGGISFQLPILIEHAPVSHVQGPFYAFGLGLFTRYASWGEGGKLTLENDLLEYKLLAGYRWRLSPKSKEAVAFFGGLDGGQFTSVSGAASGPIEDRAFHYAASIGCAMDWAL
jgi:hypothetical protein